MLHLVNRQIQILKNLMKKIKTIIKKVTKRLLLSIPIVKTRIKHYDYIRKVIFNAGWEPGHYYSPIPDLIEIERDADNIFGDKELGEIDLNIENQIRLLEKFKSYYPDYPYNSEPSQNQNFRYKKEGAFYRFSDSIFLYCMIRYFKPKKIIEVGSGHSSALMLDTNEYFFDNKIHFTFIEPYPEERLLKILKESDKKAHNIIEDKVQSINIEEFPEK